MKLRHYSKALIGTYGILEEKQDEVHNLIQNPLHLLVAPLSNGG